MKDLPSGEKPREKAIKHGVGSLSNTELLAILFRTGTKNQSVMDLSREVLKTFHHFEHVEDLRYASLSSLSGIGEAKALTLLAALELGRRVYFSQKEQLFKIHDSKDVYEYCHSFLELESQEKFLCLFLNIHNQVLAQKVLFVGTVDQSIVHSRDIFREAMLHNATKIICVHNHPTGNSRPSVHDEATTQKIKKIGDYIGIKLVDHIIIGHGEYYSFLEHGRMGES